MRLHFYGGGGGGEHLNVENSISLEQQGGGGNGLDFSYGSSSFLNTESFRFQEEEEEEEHYYHHHQHHSFLIPSLEEKMPFLQMLQSVESPPYSPFPEQTHFQVLLKYQQQQQPWVKEEERKYKYLSEVDSRIQALELESCITHEISEAHSPVKSETTNKEQSFPQTTSSHLEVVSSFCNHQELNTSEKRKNNNNTSWVDEKSKTQLSNPISSSTNNQVVVRERRKRKRTRPSKNREEVETQRMTHIAVERNRRRQMNDHLSALRSLMPSSFIQRGDQASIIGGAIDFVKELEQLLQSLEAKKRMRDGSCEKQQEEGDDPGLKKKKKKKRCDGDSLMAFNGFFSSPQYTSYSSMYLDNGDNDDDEKEEMDKKRYRRDDDEEKREAEEEEEEMKKCVVADIEVIVIQTHVNLKILSPKRHGQLIRVIAALEELRLTILHLNITSLQNSVLYSFNLKIEDDCKVGTGNNLNLNKSKTQITCQHPKNNIELVKFYLSTTKTDSPIHIKVAVIID